MSTRTLHYCDLCDGEYCDSDKTGFCGNNSYDNGDSIVWQDNGGLPLCVVCDKHFCKQHGKLLNDEMFCDEGYCENCITLNCKVCNKPLKIEECCNIKGHGSWIEDDEFYCEECINNLNNKQGM